MSSQNDRPRGEARAVYPPLGLKLGLRAASVPRTIMPASFNPSTDLEAALRAAAPAAGLDPATYDPGVRTADPVHGDFQANGILGYAKQAKTAPRPLAERLVAALPPAVRSAYEVSVAGPGFINFSAKPPTLGAWLAAHSTREELARGAAGARAGRTCVVDYSSPNTAKQMHVGHLRSAVIGEALSRLLAFDGATVIRDNHVGDWGTQFGKLIYAYRRWADAAALQSEPIEELERLYKLGNAATPDGSPELEEARRELVRLQQGDPASVALWRTFNEASLRAFQAIYDRLGIRFDHALGESFYNDKVGAVYEALTSARIAVESEGALAVFHPEHPRFKTQPFLIRKSDGAANYASTDLATLRYRADVFHATDILYVTDKRQGDHFEQLFLTAAKWFAREGRPLPRLVHVDFGTVLGEDGRPLKTRTGDNVRLKDLLGEACERAFALVTTKNPELPEAERREIAEVVGVGSVQYADLSQNRSSDYLFAWDKMISLEGNTAAYLLYAVARIRSIFRRNDLDAAATSGAGDAPETPAEIALARRIVRFPDAVRLATDTLRPHFLCLYLYELTGEFSAFYTAEKVLVDDPVVRARRLMLCARTLLILETGLDLLGLRTLARM
jgi:arginyl-tRNA synthetase